MSFFTKILPRTTTFSFTNHQQHFKSISNQWKTAQLATKRFGSMKIGPTPTYYRFFATKTGDKSTPRSLHAAISSSCNVRTIRNLLDAGVDIGRSHEWEKCTGEEIPSFSIESMRGGPSSKYVLYKETPLYVAVKRGIVAIVEELLKRGADIESESTKRYWPYSFPIVKTPLSQAYKDKNYKIMELLIKYGADVNRLVDNKFRLPGAYRRVDAKYRLIDLAHDAGDKRMVNFLIEHGSKPPARKK